MQGWHAEKYANKAGMMHESKGQCVMVAIVEGSKITHLEQ